jgi:hypothetical protein
MVKNKKVQKRDQHTALLELLKVKIQSMMHMLLQAILFSRFKLNLNVANMPKKIVLLNKVNQKLEVHNYKIKSTLMVSNKSINRKPMLEKR